MAAAAKNPPHLLIDAAVPRIMQWAGCPEAPAVTMLLRAIQAGNVWVRVPVLDDHRPWAAEKWTGAVIDLPRFRATGIGGVVVQGRDYHLHFAKLDQESFDWWLGREPKAEPVMAAEPPPKRRGGRLPKYAWDRVMRQIVARIEDDGAPIPGSGEQAELESYVRTLFPADDCPAVSTIRAKIHEAIATAQRNLGQLGQ